MRALRPVLVAIAVASLAVVAPAAGAATVDVQIRDFAFQPAFTRIDQGDEVRWVQGGSTTHTVTARGGSREAFDAEVSPGDEFRRTFPSVGRFAYHCMIHPEMRGVVEVGDVSGVPLFARRIRSTVGAERARASFFLPRPARASLTVAHASKPRKVLRRGGARRVRDDRVSLGVRIAGLAPGRYLLDIEAIDGQRVSGVTRVRSFRVSRER